MPTLTKHKDGSVSIDLEGYPEGDERMDSQSVNILHFLKDKKYLSYYNEDKKISLEEMLKEMGQVVVDDYEEDLASRSVWEENTAEQVKLFTSFMQEKTFPWRGASNVNLPFLTIAALHSQSRAYDAIIPAKDIVRAYPVGNPTQEEIEKADRITKYMNYQLLYKMKDFDDGMDKTLLQLPISGNVFRKTYRDFTDGVNRSEWLSAMDVVVNYGERDIDKADRITHRLYLTINQIRKRVASGFFIPKAWGLGPGNDSTGHSDEVQDQMDESIGVEDTRTGLSKPRVILEQYRDWDIDGDGIAEPYIITVDYETRDVLRIVDRRDFNGKGEIVVVNYFTHYGFIPNPEGFYLLVLGSLLRGLNEAGNTIINEVIDAGSLANLVGGFVTKRSGIKKGMLSYKMGEFKEVDTYIEDIKKALWVADFKGPNQTLYAVLGLIYEYSKLVSSVSETMTGQLPASDTPATTVLAWIEEGRKVFSAIHKRIYRSFSSELEKLYRLNSLYVQDDEYFAVVGDNGMPTGPTMQIGRTDFLDTINIFPVADPVITSRAETLMKVQQTYSIILENPLTRGNLVAVYEVTKRFLEALDVHNVEALLPKPEEPKPVSPVVENGMVLREEAPVVHPLDDDLEHMDTHEALMKGPFGLKVTPQGKKILEKHKQDHIAALYIKETTGEGKEVMA